LRLFLHNPAHTQIYTLSLHDALPIWVGTQQGQRLLIGLSAVGALFMLLPYFWPFRRNALSGRRLDRPVRRLAGATLLLAAVAMRSEEHTSELQSRFDLVCRLLLEKKK